MKRIFTILFLAFFLQIFAQNDQIVQANDFKINGNIDLFATKKDFLKIIKKPYKIVEDFPGCGGFDEEVSKGTRFFIYTKNGMKYYVYNKKADLIELDLNKNTSNYITFGKYKISGKTELKDLKKVFPIAYKNYVKNRDALLRLKFNKDWDDELQILIRNNKVIAVFYWSAC